jgi:hypothetical protein
MLFAAFVLVAYLLLTFNKEAADVQETIPSRTEAFP